MSTGSDAVAGAPAGRLAARRPRRRPAGAASATGAVGSTATSATSATSDAWSINVGVEEVTDTVIKLRGGHIVEAVTEEHEISWWVAA